MSARWFLLQSGACPSAENMAWDEGLLEAAGHIGRPVLRFYGWIEPAATFGYFQKFAEVQAITTLRPLIRRPTGGGLVPHDADWTYSLIVPPDGPWYELKARDSYRRIHEWIQAGFAHLGVETALSPIRRIDARGRCFTGAEQFDLLRLGQKIAGAAQRRNRDGLLIQGSIQPPSGIARPDFERAFCEIKTKEWDIQWHSFEASSSLRQRVAELSARKYSQPLYNERR
jgi:lipoate-protein ligase A